MRLPVTPPELILHAKLVAAHKAFVARKIAEAEAQATWLAWCDTIAAEVDVSAKAAKEAAEADSLTVGTAAFEARYRIAIAEWKLVCDISDTDCE